MESQTVLVKAITQTWSLVSPALVGLMCEMGSACPLDVQRGDWEPGFRCKYAQEKLAPAFSRAYKQTVAD